MELNLIKEQMAHDYSRSVEIYPDVEAAVDSAFKAGFDARQQLLQQTDVSGSLPPVEAIAFAKWLKHLDNGDVHYNPLTKAESPSIGFSPFDCFVDDVYTVEELYKRWKELGGNGS